MATESNSSNHIITDDMPKKTFKDMTPDEKRAYKRATYEKYKEAYQLAKIAKGITDKSRKVREKTLEKYGLQKTGDTYTIPKKYKFKLQYTESVIKPPPPVINVVIAPETTNISEYDLENNKFNGIQLKNWSATILTKLPKKLGSDEVRGKREIQEYFKIPNMLSELYHQKYDETKDLTPWVRDTTSLIKHIEDHKPWVASGTKSKFLGRILFLMKNFEPLKNRINKDIYTMLDSQYNKWEGLAKAGQRKKTKETPIFSWDVIKNSVIKKYGKTSYETMLISLYDEMIGRDDFQLNMAYNNSGMNDKKKNYLLLERNKEYAAVYMNKFKTVGRYGRVVYRLSPELFKMICKLHPNDTAEYLFPMEGDKLGEFLIKSLRAIPLFKDVEGLGIKYLRHSLVSTKLMKINPKAKDYDEQVFALAESAMHSVKMQETYTSPLKNEAGRIINNKFVESSEAFDEWMHTLDDLPDEDFEPKYNKELIGAEIAKSFKNPKTKKFQLYSGKIVGAEDGYYKVVYSDNDVEDLTENEVKAHLKK